MRLVLVTTAEGGFAVKDADTDEFVALCELELDAQRVEQGLTSGVSVRITELANSESS